MIADPFKDNELIDPIRLLQFKITQVEGTVKKTSNAPTGARHLWAVGEYKRLKAELARLKLKAFEASLPEVQDAND